MRFQRKLFLLFILSIILTLLTTTSFVFFLLKRHSDIYENRTIEKALAEGLGYYGEGRPDSQKLYESLLSVNREYVKAKILKKDVLIRGISSLLLFLMLQAVVMFLLYYFVIRAVTSQLRTLVFGIKQVRGGEGGFRFPVLKGLEFRLIGLELNSMLERLEEGKKALEEQSKIAGWQEVISFLSHQLKNPLTSISLAGKNVELCWQTPEKGSVVEANLSIIGEEVARLNSLINRLKELSSFPTLSLAAVDLGELIAGISGRYETGNAEFRIELPPSSIITGDRQMLEQVFLNLFNNSREAAQGKPVRICVSGKRTEKGFLVTVRDSITGLPEGFADKVFIPKFTTKKGGMGLGLQFVRKIILMHGGNISVSLTEAGGLEFTIILKDKEYEE